MTEKTASLSADIAEFGTYPVHVRKIEKELAASIDSSEQQRHYFYAEVDKGTSCSRKHNADRKNSV